MSNILKLKDVRVVNYGFVPAGVPISISYLEKKSNQDKYKGLSSFEVLMTTKKGRSTFISAILALRWFIHYNQFNNESLAYRNNENAIHKFLMKSCDRDMFFNMLQESLLFTPNSKSKSQTIGFYYDFSLGEIEFSIEVVDEYKNLIKCKEPTFTLVFHINEKQYQVTNQKGHVHVTDVSNGGHQVILTEKPNNIYPQGKINFVENPISGQELMNKTNYTPKTINDLPKKQQADLQLLKQCYDAVYQLSMNTIDWGSFVFQFDTIFAYNHQIEWLDVLGGEEKLHYLHKTSDGWETYLVTDFTLYMRDLMMETVHLKEDVLKAIPRYFGFDWQLGVQVCGAHSRLVLLHKDENNQHTVPISVKKGSKGDKLFITMFLTLGLKNPQVPMLILYENNRCENHADFGDDCWSRLFLFFDKYATNYSSNTQILMLRRYV